MIALLALLATVTSAPPPTSYSCTGSATVFTIPFPYLSASHIAANVTSSAGTVTTLVQPAGYSVKPSLAPSTGTLTLTIPCVSGATLTITRNVPYTQPQGFRTSSYQGAIHEQAFDRLEMQIQRLSGTAASATASGLLSATDWVRFNTIATNQIVTSINSIAGINDPTATLTVLENGRVSQLPYIAPYTWFRMDQFTGSLGAQPVAVLLGEKQEVSAFTRTTTGTVVVAGVETTAAAGQLRFQDNPPGLLIETGRTNFISAPDAPISQTGLALAANFYHLRVEGSGSIAVALATGTATGLPCTATAATDCQFSVTVSGTVNTTVTGVVTFAQLENASEPTSRIHTASTRNADQLSIPSVLRNGRDWIVSVRAQPSAGYPWGQPAAFGPAVTDRGLFVIGDATNVANSAFGYVGGSDGALRFQVNDSANALRGLNAATAFLGNVEHEFWFWASSDGQLEAWVDGQRGPWALNGPGTAIITTMPTNIRPGWSGFSYLNGVVKDFKVYYDTTPDRLPKPQWIRVITPNTVACLGDSITFGTNVTTPYPTTLQTTLGAGWTVLNAGVGGDQTWQTLGRWGAGVRRQTHKYVVLFSGTNDIANSSLLAPTAWANLTRIATQVRTDGKTLILVTIIPRTPMTTAQNAERVKLNNLIKAYCAAGNATCVDADPDFDNGDGRTLKASYDSGDHIHPNQAGADHLAAIVAAAIPH